MRERRSTRSSGISREEFAEKIRENASEEDEFDYDGDLEIDPHFLDAEWLNQPALYMKYARASARANQQKALAEERVKTIRSELVNKAKDTEHGKNATTLEAYYRTNEGYKKAKQAFLDASLNADLLNGAVFAFQMRKVALENLVRLSLSEYYSEPNAPKDIADSAKRYQELKQKSTQNRIKERMRR